MIISKQKQFKDILEHLKENNIFIIGCGKCAKKLQVGGEPEVMEMKKRLVSAGKNITGWTVLNTACMVTSVDDLVLENPGIARSDALLVMSCGGGVSVISKSVKVPVYPALDTGSLGGVFGEETMQEQCGMCGECTIWTFGGICPVARCAKGLLNGPCGGALDGKCEVDELPCAWDEIFEKLNEIGKLEYIRATILPKDHNIKRRKRT